MTALDRYGHLSEEIFRACRLVVDTGMHALGWTRGQAVDYMLEHTAASKENIVGEVDRWDLNCWTLCCLGNCCVLYSLKLGHCVVQVLCCPTLCTRVSYPSICLYVSTWWLLLSWP